MKKIACILSGNFFGDMGLVTLISYYLYTKKKILVLDSSNDVNFKHVFTQVRKKFIDKTIIYRSTKVDLNRVDDIPYIDPESGKTGPSENSSEDQSIIQETTKFTDMLKSKYEGQESISISDLYAESMNINVFESTLVIYKSETICTEFQVDHVLIFIDESQKIDDIIESIKKVSGSSKLLSCIFYKIYNDEIAQQIKSKFPEAHISIKPFEEIPNDSINRKSESVDIMMNNINVIVDSGI